MSWKEVKKVEQRNIFVMRYLNGERMTDLCKEYEISRKTGYKFLGRFNCLGIEGLQDQSRRPHNIPRKTTEVIEKCILNVKAEYPTWGAKKIKVKLENMHQGILFPAPSTIGMILDKHGLVKKNKRRIKRAYHPTALTPGDNPNDVWCVDYKGQFKTGKGIYCYPLTITDYYSRYIISCEALENTRYHESKVVFREAFLRYGLPKIIRSDNGTPFASMNAIFGLTKLSAWLIKLGIKMERIEPGHPEQNGRHERMHRTLKEETTRPAATNILKQQERFDSFVNTYNFQRPHEAIGMKVPGILYKESEYKYTNDMEDPLKYSLHDIVRKISYSGYIKIVNNKEVFISSALSGENIGLRELDEGWLVSYANYDIGYISKLNFKFESMEYLSD